MAIAIESLYADEEILYDSLRFIVTQAYQNFKPYVEQERSDNKHQTLFIKLEKLADVWGQKQKASFRGNSEA